MSVGFAGSARTGERRRRRLATDLDAAPASGKRRHRVDAAHAAGESVAVFEESPLHSVLPQNRWKLVAITVLSWWLLVAVIAVALIGEHQPRWQATVGFRSGHLLQTLGTILLIGSAQWCWVIYWYRRRGRRDFAGDYRRWLLAGGTFLLALPCWTTGEHRTLGVVVSGWLTGSVDSVQTLAPSVGDPIWNTPDVCWMVPFGAAAVLYGLGLLREMLPLRLRGLLLLAGLAWLAMAASAILIGPAYRTSAACELLSVVCTTVSLWCFFHCLWLQARHVVRVTNEPPRPGAVKRLALREAVEASLQAVERGQSAVTSPYRVVRTVVADWQQTRSDRTEQRAAAKQERREAKEAAKAAAAADREAMKQAKQEAKEAAQEARRLAAEAKADAKEQAAAEKRAARLAAAEAKAAAQAAEKQPPAVEDAPEPETPASAAGAEVELAPPETPVPVEDRGSRRSRRRAAGATPEPAVQDMTPDVDEAAMSGSDFDDEEDLSHLSRKERRRLRKQRRGQSQG